MNNHNGNAMRRKPYNAGGEGGKNRRFNHNNRNNNNSNNFSNATNSAEEAMLARQRKVAPQHHQKYMNMGRDAMAAGDRVLAEYYYQHADHYFRLMMEDNAMRQQRQQRFQQQQQAQHDTAAPAAEDPAALNMVEPVVASASTIPAGIPAGIPPAIPAAMPGTPLSYMPPSSFDERNHADEAPKVTALFDPNEER